MSDAVSVMGIEHTGIATADPEALAQWYRTTLGGLEISRSSDNPPVVFLSFGGGALLELIPAKSGAKDLQQDNVHLCFSVDNVDAAVDALARTGTALEKPVFAAYEGSPVAFFRDPAGNLLQLVQRVPGSEVHREVYGT